MVVSDINVDLDLTEDSLGLIVKLAKISKAPVIARGLSRTLDDLARIKFVPNISGAIVGRALFDRSYSIEDALSLGAQETTPTAKFV